jgi:hypothetical protein
MEKKLKKWFDKSIDHKLIDFNNVEREYLELIESSPKEELVQKFIENHSYLLLQARNKRRHTALVSKPKLADEFIPDFIMFGGCNDYWITLVEIEKPSDLIFTKNGDYSSAFSKALRQIADWKAWLYNNSELFSKYFSHPWTIEYEIVIGRRINLKDSLHKLKTFENSITISTFDSLIPLTNQINETRNGFIQKYAITFSEYKEIFNIKTGQYNPNPIAGRMMRNVGYKREHYVDPWFLYWLWEH